MATFNITNRSNEENTLYVSDLTRLTKSRTIQIRKEMRKPKFSLYPHTKPDGIQHIVKSIETLTVEIPKDTSPSSAAKSNKANIIDEPDFQFIQPKMIDLIPKTEFIECVISHVASPGHLFAVQRFCDVEDINNLMFELNKNASTLKQIKNPECDKIYGVKFANIWHRGQVVTVEPLTVEYIDYGATETITDGQLIDLGEYAYIPKFSVHVRLPRESVEEYKLLEVDSIIVLKMVASDPKDDIINVIVKPDGIQQAVKSIETLTVAKLSTPKIDNNVKVVNVEVPKKLEKISEVKTPSPLPPPSSSAAKSNKANIIDEPDFRFLVSQMIDLIPKTEFIECVISHVASPGYLFAVQRFCDVEDINNLIFELNENASTLKQIKNPACGLRYGVKFENIWLRAQVVRDEPLTVEYIDYGTFETITDGQFIDLGEYAFIPRFSVLVRLPRESIEEYKLLEVESIIDLKMVASDPEDDFIDVIVKPDGIQQAVKSIETLTVAKLSTPKIDNNVKVVNVEVPKKLEKISEVKTPSPPPQPLQQEQSPQPLQQQQSPQPLQSIGRGRGRGIIRDRPELAPIGFGRGRGRGFGVSATSSFMQ